MIRKYILSVALFCVAALACTKEMPRYPYTGLLQFTIADVQGSTLKGVIENDEIIVYWPPYLAVPDSISAAITVAEKASVLPASGSKVAFDGKTAYVVTAEDGSKKTYRLKPVINQPLTYIERTNGDLQGFGENLVIVGDFFIADSNQTKAYLVTPDNKEIPLAYYTQYEGVQMCTQTQLWLRIPEAVKDTIAPVPMGDYGLKVVTGRRTAVYEGKIKLVFLTPYLTSASPAVAKAGDVITLGSARPLVAITGVSGVNAGTGEVFPFELISYTKDALKVKIPAQMKAGSYYQYQLKSKAYGAETTDVWMVEGQLDITQ